MMAETLTERISAWILRSRWHATLSLAAIFSLGWWLPPLAGPLFAFSSAVVVLIALQVGTRGSLEVGALSAAAVALLTIKPAVGLAFVLLWLPVWLLGEVLRRSGTLRAASWVLLGLGAVIVALAVYAVPGEASGYWTGVLQQALSQVAQDGGANAEAVAQLAALFPGLMGASAVVVWVLALLLGRWMQASYAEEHTLQGEPFRDWSLPNAFLLILPLAFLLGWLGSGDLALFGQNIGLILGVLFMFQGLAVIHTVAGLRQWPWQVLLAFYVILILLAQLAFVVSGLGIADKALDLRQRLQER